MPMNIYILLRLVISLLRLQISPSYKRYFNLTKNEGKMFAQQYPEDASAPPPPYQTSSEERMVEFQQLVDRYESE